VAACLPYPNLAEIIMDYSLFGGPSVSFERIMVEERSASSVASSDCSRSVASTTKTISSSGSRRSASSRGKRSKTSGTSHWSMEAGHEAEAREVCADKLLRSLFVALSTTEACKSLRALDAYVLNGREVVALGSLARSEKVYSFGRYSFPEETLLRCDALLKRARQASGMLRKECGLARSYVAHAFRDKEGELCVVVKTGSYR
jgi:hypothetical protein